ncbi:putative HC-toxin efflux carrier TOXA [Tolypocladium ophioglossoides CBS 100239]|uniref:Putative HC-toxin efflux carrier TOXA n=1 Tax=Tolypocladium ophioglossoides (strain CBS 100239) TaxID=1163406 RepID=A0A0L0N248_TOLOC|nr:putative HC-toxin efflux carrier TOXA [Tolypocladium ophioglossoides CBS 100239]
MAVLDGDRRRKSLETNTDNVSLRSASIQKDFPQTQRPSTEKSSPGNNVESTPTLSSPGQQQDGSAAKPDIEKPAPSGPAFQQEAEANYKPKTAKFWLVVLSAFVPMFLVALDRTILSTAIPRITDDFKRAWAILAVLLFFFLDSPSRPQKPAPVKEHIMRLDPLATFFFVPSVTCLLLTLQWGGSTYPWSNWCIILLFVTFALAAIAFGVVQVMMPDSAALPIQIITQRTILAGTFVMFFLSGGMLLTVYYFPLWFQTTHGIDPVQSGIYSIRLILSLVVASLASGALTQRIGYYMPSMILCPCVTAVGQGLITTFTPNTDSSHWIAY